MKKISLISKSILSIAVLCLCFVFGFSINSNAATTYLDGEYEGSGVGYDNGTITLKVTIKEGKITKIETVDASSQTKSYYTVAEDIFDSIIKAQSTNVDVITGATKSSNGIKEAVLSALEKAVDNRFFDSGSGTQKAPYVIKTADQLVGFSQAVDSGETFKGQYIVLGSDIDLSTVENFNPIGDENASVNVFEGNFDGQNKTVSNMKISASVESGAAAYGLFSYLGNGSVVKNINVKDADVKLVSTSTSNSDRPKAGIIAGASLGTTEAITIVDCVTTSGKVSVEGKAYTYGAGIVGTIGKNTIISNVVNNADIEVSCDGANFMVAGIVGNSGNKSFVINAINNGNITGNSKNENKGTANVGGIEGMAAGNEFNVVNTGNITVNQANNNQKYGPVNASDYSSSACKYFIDSLVITVNGKIMETASTDDTDTKVLAKDFYTESFQKTLNNLYPSYKAFKEAGYKEYADLKLWKLEDKSLIPTGENYVNKIIDASIFAAGEGTKENPYQIADKTQLIAFANSLDDGIDYNDAFIKLTKDIDISGMEWTPVGGSDYVFNGTFDGDNHTISGMTIGSKDAVKELDSSNIYVGFFGAVTENARIKNLSLTDVYMNLHYKATARVGGIVGVMSNDAQNSDRSGAVIDNVYVQGQMNLTQDKGNLFLGGIVGYMYKGAVINSHTDVSLSGVVNDEALAEVGGIVALTNRGLIANCYSTGDGYGSGNRDGGNEGMAEVSNIAATNAGSVVGCLGTGNITTKELSYYAGTISGWVTGLGKAYQSVYNSSSVMTINESTVSPLNDVGTLTTSGTSDETGEYFNGGLKTDLTGIAYNRENYAKIAEVLNGYFSSYGIDLAEYGLKNTDLRKWISDENGVRLSKEYATITYKRPDCEYIPEEKMEYVDGTYYGRDKDRSVVVKITVENKEIKNEEVIVGSKSLPGYEEALEEAKTKCKNEDTTDYFPVDPTKFAGGKGTKEDSYLISNADQLTYLSASINSDNTYEGVYFKQTTDITLNSENFLPIGWYREIQRSTEKYSVLYPFRGNYDGGNFNIYGLKQDSSKYEYPLATTGLFGFTSGDYANNEEPDANWCKVCISNVNIVDADIDLSVRLQSFAGVLVGQAQKGIFINNCHTSGNLDVTVEENIARAGGIAGNTLRGYVINSSSEVNINSNSKKGTVYAAGIVPSLNRTAIVNSYARGNITGAGDAANRVLIGGITAQNGGFIYNCYADCSVVSKSVAPSTGAVTGSLAGIGTARATYFNTQSLLQSADTVISPAIATGTNFVENEETVTGKTGDELKTQEFADLLNNGAKDALNQLKEMEAYVTKSGLGHKLYYNGEKLDTWVVSEGIVTLKSLADKEAANHVSEIKLDKNSATIYAGKTTKIKAYALPETAINKDLAFSSSNKKIATVDEKGIVTAKKAGKAVITVTSLENNNIKAEFVVNVKANTIKLTAKKATLYTVNKKTLKLDACINGRNNSKLAKWTSSNKKIATVNNNGLVTAKKAGKVTITAKANGVSAKCEIVVLKPTLKVDKTSVLLKKGKTLKLKVNATPATKITYKSSNIKIATVSDKGVIRAKKAGKVTITIKANNILKKVTVKVTK
ncbi:Ig-like domain (group 2) [Acetitomaculum ruminis DSM 5522]|uniref:Ig-like domain (Group 2) n=1 Tax=Acetitomaculum ruminis DSM 5522 TaxID=1120918 RepID=A0A1I0ZW60_9FIRM|nr:Ig-like domain-containing protein [Acetitomaculum ruminis]SFB29572.1 Ig-like domain (group 2) [Acetitomaculum ruminis DSM 5522]